jgi:hypothetical protein
MAAVKTVIEDLRTQPEHPTRREATSPVITYAGGWGYCPVGLPLVARDDDETLDESGA